MFFFHAETCFLYICRTSDTKATNKLIMGIVKF